MFNSVTLTSSIEIIQNTGLKELLSINIYCKLMEDDNREICWWIHFWEMDLQPAYAEIAVRQLEVSVMWQHLQIFTTVDSIAQFLNDF